MVDLVRDNKGYYQPGNLVSVTTVLPFDSSGIPKETLKSAARRGEAVHEAAFIMDGGKPEEPVVDLEALHPSWRPYVIGYDRFIKDKSPTYTEMEMVVCSRNHGFAGRLDRIGSYEGKPAIFDLKTGPVSAFEALQMSAYLSAFGEGQETNTHQYSRISIHVTSDGNYSVHQWDKGGDGSVQANDLGVFLKFLDTHRWLVENGVRKPQVFSTLKAQKPRSEEIGEEISVLDQPAIATKLDLLDFLKGKKSECEALEKALKNHFEGVELVSVGDWVIEGKETERLFKPKPAQDARISRGWSTKFTRIGDKK